MCVCVCMCVVCVCVCVCRFEEEQDVYNAMMVKALADRLAEVRSA